MAFNAFEDSTFNPMKELYPDFRRLNLLSPPEYAFTKKDCKWLVFDVIRKRWLLLTPEEWVRQHLVAELLVRGYPPATLSLERSFEVEGLQKRFDMAVFGAEGILMLVECKAPHISIDEQALSQALRYNRMLKSPTILITNGLSHNFYVHTETGYMHYEQTIPDFVQLKKIVVQL